MDLQGDAFELSTDGRGLLVGLAVVLAALFLLLLLLVVVEVAGDLVVHCVGLLLGGLDPAPRPPPPSPRRPSSPRPAPLCAAPSGAGWRAQSASRTPGQTAPLRLGHRRRPRFPALSPGRIDRRSRPTEAGAHTRGDPNTPLRQDAALLRRVAGPIRTSNQRPTWTLISLATPVADDARAGGLMPASGVCITALMHRPLSGFILNPAKPRQFSAPERIRTSDQRLRRRLTDDHDTGIYANYLTASCGTAAPVARRCGVGASRAHRGVIDARPGTGPQAHPLTRVNAAIHRLLSTT